MLKSVVFILLCFPVLILGQIDSLDNANPEYFRPKIGDYYLNGNASWSNASNINVIDIDLFYKKMISDRRFYGGSVGLTIIQSHSFIMFGPIYGIYFAKNSGILDMPNYPYIMGYLSMISTYEGSTEFGIVSYIGATFPLKGRIGLTPSLMIGYALDLIVGFNVGIEIDPN